MEIRRSKQIEATLLDNLLVAHGRMCKILRATSKELITLTRWILKLSDQLGDEIIYVGTEVNKEGGGIACNTGSKTISR